MYIVTSARALILLSKTGSLDNAIQEFPLAWPLWVMNHHIISSVIHTFWLVLTYDLLEDRHIDDVIIKTLLILYCIKQINSKLPCVCSVIDHRGCQNVVRTSVTHSAAPCVPLFCSCHILTSSVIYYWTDARQLGIYLLNNKLSYACILVGSHLWSTEGQTYRWCHH